MGLFGPYVYENKKGKRFFLHVKIRHNAKLYYFSKDPRGAINKLPRGFKVIENPKSGLPLLKKKSGGGILGGVFKKKKPEKGIEMTEVGKETEEDEGE